MNYDELLTRVEGVISGDLRCDRRARRQIVRDLKDACIEAADGGHDCNLDFFYRVYGILATKSRGWSLVKSSGFRARVNQTVRQYGVGSAVFVLIGLGAFLEARRQGASIEAGVDAPEATS